MSATARSSSTDNAKDGGSGGGGAGGGEEKPAVHEILSKAGLVYSEFGNLSEVLCKPKVLAIKSLSLQKIEELERKMREGGAQAEE